jgi:hypothetical protein
MTGHKRKKRQQQNNNNSNNNSNQWEEVNYDQKIEELNRVIKDQKAQLEKLRKEKTDPSLIHQQLNENFTHNEFQHQQHHTNHEQQTNHRKFDYLNVTKKLNSTEKQLNLEKNIGKNTFESTEHTFFIAKFIGINLYEYRNYLKLQKELKSCKPELKILNAYINLKNELIIKVNLEDKEKLINNWPSKAFINGIKFAPKVKKYFLALNGVDKSFDTKNEDFKSYLKQRYNIEKVIRIIKKSSNEETTTLRLETHNEESYKNILNNGIKLGYTSFKSKEWKFEENVKQCFKCQKLGHIKSQCTQEHITCLRCSETHDHHFSQCRKEIKCANCGENHPSCSKSCKILKNYTTNENIKQQNKLVKPQIPISNEIKINQLNDLRLYGGIYNSNIALVRFILDILRNLNEATTSVNENTTYIKSLITKYFGLNITKTLEKEIDLYAEEQIYESDNNETMSELYE